jgi:putative NADPH-quinone reductase
MSKRILLVLAHPAPSSFCHALAEQYVLGAIQAGAEIKQLTLSQLNFNLSFQGYRTESAQLEADLVEAQQLIKWAEHLVFVYPLWWGAMPALLKGFIDRTFLPNFAFKYRKNSALWDKLLAGRSARLLVTMDSPPWYFKWINHMPNHYQMKKTILGFCGIKPVKISSFGSIKAASDKQKQRWLQQAQQLGRSMQ